MGSIRWAAVSGALVPLALLGTLSATTGLGLAGWVVGLAAGWAMTALLAVGRLRSRERAIQPADRVTLARALLGAGVAALAAESSVRPVPVAPLVVLAAVALALDAVDGPVARRTGTVTPFGARFDGEVDAFLILVLSVLVARDYGGWVLAIGLARYALLVAGWVAPWLAAPVPFRYWRKVVAAVQGIVLTAAASGWLPLAVGMPAVAMAALLLAESFGRDVVWLYRTGPRARLRLRLRGDDPNGARRRLARRAWRWARPLSALLVLALLVRRLGAEPFLAGLRGVGPGPLLAAVALGAGTTLCAAWRWRAVAGALGVGLPLPAAIAAYYRSQFLNCTLPGGVLGDVHRGLRHGAAAGDRGRGLRAVAGERVAGQAVQVALAGAVLLAVSSPVRAAILPVVAAAAAVLVALQVARGWARRRPELRPGRRHGSVARGAVGETARALLQPAVWPAVVAASLMVVGGHLVTFFLAARTTGIDTSAQRLLPLALMVLLAAAIPLNVGGWGPREGVAAWVFAAGGFDAGTGAAVATAFGVLTTVSTLPGVAVLLADRLRPRLRPAQRPAALPLTAQPLPRQPRQVERSPGTVA